MGNLIVELDNRNHGGYMKLKKKKQAWNVFALMGFWGD